MRPKPASAAPAQVRAAAHLLEVCAHVSGAARLPPCCGGITRARLPARALAAPLAADLAEVRGQRQAKRALVIAAAGGHSLLLDRAARLRQEHAGAPPARAAAAADGGRGARGGGGRCRQHRGLSPRAIRRAPLPRAPPWRLGRGARSAAGRARGPARSASRTTACCFSTSCRSSAAPCWRRCASRSETGSWRCRARRCRPSTRRRFLLVAAMNPCPCGSLGEASGLCRCTPAQVRHYRGRVSGPLLDRLDLHVERAARARERVRRGRTR